MRGVVQLELKLGRRLLAVRLSDDRALVRLGIKKLRAACFLVAIDRLQQAFERVASLDIRARGADVRARGAGVLIMSLLAGRRDVYGVRPEQILGLGGEDLAMLDHLVDSSDTLSMTALLVSR